MENAAAYGHDYNASTCGLASVRDNAKLFLNLYDLNLQIHSVTSPNRLKSCEKCVQDPSYDDGHFPVFVDQA